MINGEIQNLPLPDLIQWLALTHRTGKLALMQSDNRSVELFVVDGEIVAATLASNTVLGTTDELVAVVGQALSWRMGQFEFTESQMPQRFQMGKLRMSAEELLAQASTRVKPAKKALNETSLANLPEMGLYSDTFTLADSLRLKVIEHLMREDFTVPVMPQLALKVLELTNDEDFSMRDLGNLVLTDQVVAARILRFANSALYSGGREIDSLAAAVQRLGASEVVNVVLAASLQTRRLGDDLFAEEKSRLNLHAATAAFLARSMSNRLQLNQNQGFLCGLLMDFGMNVIYSMIQQILGPEVRSKKLPKEVIEEIVRDYHPRVGRVVGEQWKLPASVVETMAYHHHFDTELNHSPYVWLSSLADSLTRFVLNQPREGLDEALAKLTVDRILAHRAAQLLKLAETDAVFFLYELPRSLEQAEAFVID